MGFMAVLSLLCPESPLLRHFTRFYAQNRHFCSLLRVIGPRYLQKVVLRAGYRAWEAQKVVLRAGNRAQAAQGGPGAGNRAQAAQGGPEAGYRAQAVLRWSRSGLSSPGCPEVVYQGGLSGPGCPEVVYQGGVVGPGYTAWCTPPSCTTPYTTLGTPVGHVPPAVPVCTLPGLPEVVFWPLYRLRVRSFPRNNIPEEEERKRAWVVSQRRI